MCLHCYLFEAKLVDLHHNHRDPNNTDSSSIYLKNQQTHIHHMDPNSPQTPLTESNTNRASNNNSKIGVWQVCLELVGIWQVCLWLVGFQWVHNEVVGVWWVHNRVVGVWCVCDEVVEILCVCNEFTRFWWLCNRSLTTMCHLADLSRSSLYATKRWFWRVWSMFRWWRRRRRLCRLMIGEVAEASSTVVLSMCAAEERRKHCFNVGLRVGLRESNMRVSK